METLIIIIISTLMVAGLITLIVAYAIDEIKYNKKQKLDEAKRKRENELHNMVKHIHHYYITGEHGEGKMFIKADYRHGRFYLDYESLDFNNHFSVTHTFKDPTDLYEDYCRMNTKYGFATDDHMHLYHKCQDELLEIIANLDNYNN